MGSKEWSIDTADDESVWILANPAWLNQKAKRKGRFPVVLAEVYETEVLAKSVVFTDRRATSPNLDSSPGVPFRTTS